MAEDTPETTIEPNAPSEPEGESTATLEADPEAPIPAPDPKPAVEAGPGGFWFGTGRRKAATARVRIRPGQGHFLVNGRRVETYFTDEQNHKAVLGPLRETGTEGRLDVYCRVHGGGTTGHAGAVLLGIARALARYDTSLEPILRDQGMLTRDSRRVERQKPGQPGARRKFQFSKR